MASIATIITLVETIVTLISSLSGCISKLHCRRIICCNNEIDFEPEPINVEIETTASTTRMQTNEIETTASHTGIETTGSSRV